METTISIGVIDGTLKICFADKKRYYKSISRQLVGKFSPAHWSKKKKQIKPNVENAEINNEIISEIYEKYFDVLTKNKGIDDYSLRNYFEETGNPGNRAENENSTDGVLMFEKLLLSDIENEKKKAGCNYKNYEKLLDLNSLKLQAFPETI